MAQVNNVPMKTSCNDPHGKGTPRGSSSRKGPPQFENPCVHFGHNQLELVSLPDLTGQQLPQKLPEHGAAACPGHEPMLGEVLGKKKQQVKTCSK